MFILNHHSTLLLTFFMCKRTKRSLLRLTLTGCSPCPSRLLVQRDAAVKVCSVLEVLLKWVEPISWTLDTPMLGQYIDHTVLATLLPRALAVWRASGPQGEAS